MVAKNENTLWQRVVGPSWDKLSADAAKAILDLKFAPRDIERMNDLATHARAGDLTGEQQHELETFMRVGRMLSIMQAQARISLKDVKGR